MNFQTADGASFEGRNEAGNLVFQVSMPVDDDGYLGRQCPSCRQIFRIGAEDYQALAEQVELYCVYCGHHEHHSAYVTEQQVARARQVMVDAGRQMIDQTIGKSFRNMARSAAGNPHLKVSYRSKPFYPQPLPGIDEEKLVRERRCSACALRYAVFGDHRYCPVSGPLAPLAVALDALAAETAKLDALAAIPPDLRELLREQGVFDRVYVDVLGNVVGIVETLAKEKFFTRITNADMITKGKGNVFQRLDDTADMYASHLDTNLRSVSGTDWRELLRLWAVRHVHAHNGGVVDEKYLRAVSTTTLARGQRVLVPLTDAREAIAQASALCAAL